MTIKKCDRCGKFIPEKKKSFGDVMTETINNALKIKAKTQPRYSLARDDLFDNNILDLCGECQFDLDKWLKGAKRCNIQ